MTFFSLINYFSVLENIVTFYKSVLASSEFVIAMNEEKSILRFFNKKATGTH